MVCVATARAALVAEPEPLPLQQVADNIWFVQGQAALGAPANRNFISNAGFIVTPDGVVVVDALGSPALARALLASIRSVTRQPVRWVVVTHYHADHVYGLQVFKDLGATVIARQEGREYLNSDTAQRRLEASRQELAPWVDAQTRLVPADRWLDADTTLTVGGERLLLRHVGPAHTAEDLAVFVERNRVLFAGDLVFRGRVPYVGTADSQAWITALTGLIDLKPAVIVPGHGALSREPLADLTLTRDYLQYLRRSMAEAAANLEPFEDAYARTDWSAFEHLPLFGVANRINAYNTYLLMEQAGR
ncbi:MBL fold metallo-hydrolase [Ideonella sp. NS12-5]|uniref:MBL fold metallo-hydrolase n=1 Tax=Ideonella oryzae TaxID=2937441 RepID=A0ABT1BIL5_9BURK|nr:MBL fold metallo-hydrolase [Ideonella oryzae]MCO5976067.1 MBL fold metallo-hydrolase [Ideonella oryzae]